jgi:hypothetical protein
MHLGLVSEQRHFLVDFQLLIFSDPKDQQAINGCMLLDLDFLDGKQIDNVVAMCQNRNMGTT